MERIQTWGNIPLKGEIAVQGSKNAALPLMAAAVLHRGTTVLHNCPRILDVEYMSGILRELGCRVTRNKDALVIDARDIDNVSVSAEFATKLRASVLLMGSLLGRFGCARLPYPGGCTIGQRPIDLHLQVFECMGVEIENGTEQLELHAGTEKGSCVRLKACEINFSFPSVGATENAVIGAVLAEGTTILRGCAAEPEVAELCRFLNKMGAGIQGIGGSVLVITGVRRLRDCEYRLMSDRIVAGTYLLAAAGTRGKICVQKVPYRQLRALIAILSKCGARFLLEGCTIKMDARNACLPAGCVRTEPYPGFPTDLQSQLMTFLCRAEGTSYIEENLFESRFLTAEELKRMGADITIEGRTAVVRGTKRLFGAQVKAQELRGGAALIAAGLMAEGTTVISGGRFIERGYEDICRDLRALGADIKKI